MKKKILIVDDNTALRVGLEIELRKRDFESASARDGEEAIEKIAQFNPDLVILDISMPKTNGCEVCRCLRLNHNRVPVIILTARTSEEDEIICFQVGADDFIRKPFNMDILVSRIKALLERTNPGEGERIEFGHYLLDMEAMTLMDSSSGNMVFLTPREYSLLQYFVRNANRVISRNQLLNNVWGYEYEGTDRTVDRFVTVLRQKIEKNPRRPGHIKTVRNYGYKFLP